MRLGGLQPEEYTLNSRPDGVDITGGSPAGVFYAFQTLRQLLPVAAVARGRKKPASSIARRGDRRQAALRPPRRNAGRVSSLLYRRRRENFHRHPRYAQTQSFPLAPDRRPGLADRNQTIPQTDRGRRVRDRCNLQAEADAPKDSVPTAVSRRTKSATSYNMPQNGSSRSSPKSKCRATPPLRSPLSLPRLQRRRVCRSVDLGRKSRRVLCRQRFDVPVYRRRPVGSGRTVPVGIHPYRRRRMPENQLAAMPGMPAADQNRKLKSENELQSYFYAAGRVIPRRQRPQDRRLG